MAARTADVGAHQAAARGEHHLDHRVAGELAAARRVREVDGADLLDAALPGIEVDGHLGDPRVRRDDQLAPRRALELELGSPRRCRRTGRRCRRRSRAAACAGAVSASADAATKRVRAARLGEQLAVAAGPSLGRGRRRAPVGSARERFGAVARGGLAGPAVRRIAAALLGALGEVVRAVVAAWRPAAGC